jgi:hypothetical protein
LDLSDFKFIQLNSNVVLDDFECGEADITNFLKEDALQYQMERMANTYLFLDSEDVVVAYFSISNDCLVDSGEDRGYTNTIFNRLHRKSSIPNAKRIRQYPAIKVGRLRVAEKYHKTGIAYQLMDFIKGFSILDHKPACKFLLLDAINKEKQTKYYKNNNFDFLLDDKEDKTRIMYFNLDRLF